MRSPEETLDLMANAIHNAMCYRAGMTITCTADRGDAALLIEYLAKHNAAITEVVDDASATR